MPITSCQTSRTSGTTCVSMASNQDKAITKKGINSSGLQSEKKGTGEKPNVLFSQKAAIKINLKPFNSAGKGMTIK